MNIYTSPSDEFELLYLDGPSVHPSSNDSPEHFATLAGSAQPSVLPSDNEGISIPLHFSQHQLIYRRDGAAAAAAVRNRLLRSRY